MTATTTFRSKLHLTTGLVAIALGMGSSACTIIETEEKVDKPSPVQTTPDDSNPGSVDSFLSGLPKMEVDPVVAKSKVACGDECPADTQEGKFFCTYNRYTETVRFDRFVAFQPNSATLWPGVIVHGKDAQKGQLNPLSVDLAPVTFSLSLENLNASPVGYMDTPSLSSFREVRNSILAQDVNGATAASIDFEIRQVHNESQIAVTLGAGADWPGTATVTGNFDFTSSTKQTKVLVNYTQAYYTIDVDTPTRPSAFFRDNVSVSDLEKQVSDEDPPIYVQSITYGRRVLFSIESSSDAEKLMAALEATVSKASVSGEASVKAEYESLIEESTIRAFVVGGNGGNAAAVVNGFQGLIEFIQSGGNYSKESPGAPIAYKLAYLDNATTEMAFTSDYSEPECKQNRSDFRVEILGFDHIDGGDWNGNPEFYGNVSVRYPTEGSEVTSCSAGGTTSSIWSLPKTSEIEIEYGKTWTPSSPVYTYLDMVPSDEKQRICFTASFNEKDFWSDDVFGSGELLVPSKLGWEGEHTVQVRGAGNNAMDVRIRVTAF
jgi:thiol-activated cytolysin